jgi:hypothetical protein
MRHDVGPFNQRLRRLGVGLWLSLCGAAGPATQPSSPNAEPPADPKVLLQKLQDEANEKAAELERWPSIGERKIEDVLVLDYDGLTLIPRTLLTATPRPRSLTVEGMPGSWEATLRFNRAGRPINFTLKHLDPSDPETPFVYAELSAFPGKANLVYQRETIRSSSFIQLVDDRTAVDPSSTYPDGQCRLYVQVHDANTDDPIVDAQFAEPDLASLIAKHRAVADVYIRPMLRELGQERLMLPDLRVVRQVLAVQVKVDPAVMEQVRQLVGKLDSDDFAQRLAATAALKKLGLPAAKALGQIDRSTLSTEQHNRIDEILDANRPITGADAERLGTDKAFLIDCLELDDPDARAAAVAKLQRVIGAPIEVGANAPPAERRAKADALRAKWLPTPEKLSERPGQPAPSSTRPALKTGTFPPTEAQREAK